MRRVFSIFVAMAMATPLAAQDRMTPEQCAQSAAAVVEMTQAPVSLPEAQIDEQGWCVLTDLEFATNEVTRTRVGSLRWRASDVGRFIADGLPPRAIEIQGRGVGVVTVTDDPVFNYLLRLQSSRMQLGFGAAARWDGVQNVVFLDNAYLNFDATNRVEISGRINALDLTDIGSIQTSMGTMGLRDLTVKSQFDGWFESYAAMIIGTAILTDDAEAPEAQVAEIKRLTIEFVGELPDAFMPKVSRDALSAFVTALPTPRGSAQLQISADPPIGAARLTEFASLEGTPTAADVIERGLDGVRALFTWTPTGGAQ